MKRFQEREPGLAGTQRLCPLGLQTRPVSGPWPPQFAVEAGEPATGSRVTGKVVTSARKTTTRERLILGARAKAFSAGVRRALAQRIAVHRSHLQGRGCNRYRNCPQGDAVVFPLARGEESPKLRCVSIKAGSVKPLAFDSAVFALADRSRTGFAKAE